MFTVAAAIMSIIVMVLAVVATDNIRIVFQVAGQKVSDGLIRISAYAAIQFDTRLGQSAFCAVANTAADQCVYAALFQDVSQRTVAAAICVHDRSHLNFSIPYVIDLKSLRVPKVLKYLSVFIRYCNSHLFASNSSSRFINAFRLPSSNSSMVPAQHWFRAGDQLFAAGPAFSALFTRCLSFHLENFAICNNRCRRMRYGVRKTAHHLRQFATGVPQRCIAPVFFWRWHRSLAP